MKIKDITDALEVLNRGKAKKLHLVRRNSIFGLVELLDNDAERCLVLCRTSSELYRTISSIHAVMGFYQA